MTVFKKITKKDYQSLLTFFENNRGVEFFDPFDLDEKTAAAIVKPDKNNLYYGVFWGDKIVGFGMLRWWKDYKCPTLGLIVDKEYRGRGFGKKIYSFLFKKAKAKGCRNISAIVNPENIASYHVATSLGMEAIDQLALEGEYDFTEYIKNNKQKIVLIKKLYE
jgi:RimJ/RimL family protein N-acetyltransferase